MVDFKGLRETVIDPLMEFADHARKMATELEQFSSETNTQKKALLAAWAGLDAVAAITALSGHSEDYRKTSSSFKELDEIVLELTQKLKWAKGVLESAISMVSSIPGSINESGSITINYGALGPNPTQAAVNAAEARAKQVHEQLKKAIETATEADTTAQAKLAQLIAAPSQADPTAKSQTGGDPSGSNGVDPSVAHGSDSAAKPGTGGTDPAGKPATGDTDPGTKPGDTAPGTKPGDTAPGAGDTKPGTGDTKPGTGEPGTKPGDTPGGKRNEMQAIGKMLDGLGELLSGHDGNEPGERTGIQIIGDALEGIGGALIGDGGAATPAPGDGTIPAPGDGTIPAPGDGSTPAPGDGTTPAPGDGNGGTDPAPGDGGTSPGNGGTAPGSGGDAPGNGGTAPGSGGDTPGNGGTTPGGGDTNPSTGHGGDTSPGNGGQGDGSGGDGNGDNDGNGDGNADPGGAVPAPGQAPAPVGGLNQAQMNNAATIIAVGERMGISEHGQQIALATAMQESSFRNLANSTVPDSMGLPNEGSGSDHDSVGVFQQRPSQGWGTVAECMDVEHSATSFYSELQRVDGWENMEVSEAAQAVQRSAYPDAYARWEGLSQQILDAVD